MNLNPISTDTRPRPLSPYGIAKLAAEQFLDAYFLQSPVQVTHVRLCSVASCGEHPSQVLSQLCHSAFQNEAIKVNAGHTMNLLYTDEAVDLIISAALGPDRANYIVTTPPVLVEALARRFEEISGKTLNASYEDLNRGATDPVFQSDIELLREDWVRQTPLDQMIQKIIGQYLSSEDAPMLLKG